MSVVYRFFVYVVVVVLFYYVFGLLFEGFYGRVFLLGSEVFIFVIFFFCRVRGKRWVKGKKR